MKGLNVLGSVNSGYDSILTETKAKSKSFIVRLIWKLFFKYFLKLKGINVGGSVNSGHDSILTETHLLHKSMIFDLIYMPINWIFKNILI